MSKIGESIKSAANSAKAKTSRSSSAAREKASVALEKSKGAAAAGVEHSRVMAQHAKTKTSDGIDKNPLAIVLGGIAIGAIVGAEAAYCLTSQRLYIRLGERQRLARGRRHRASRRHAGAA